MQQYLCIVPINKRMNDLRRWITLCEAIVPDWILGDQFHGTARNSLEFRPNRVAYFTPSVTSARDHALMDSETEGGTPRVIRVRLSVKNPAVIDSNEMQDLHFLPDQVSELESHGHDCAVGEHDNEIAVFDIRNIHIQEIMDVQVGNDNRTI